VDVVGLFGFAGAGALSADAQGIALDLDVYVLGLDARQRNVTLEPFAVLVDARFDGGNKPFRAILLFLGQTPVQEAIENIIEISANVEQITGTGRTGE